MENAPKALLMAGGVLLGIMILSLAVYLFSNFGSTSSTIHENIEANQISQFNSQFMQYVGKENVTIYDVISMANLATENNKYYEFDKRATMPTGNDNYITILLNNQRIEYGYGNTSEEIEDDYNEKLSNETKNIINGSSDLPKYNVQVEISGTTRRVYIVKCTKK